MKQTSANQKTAQRNRQALDQAPSAGSKGMAITPPAYGIGSIDLGLTEPLESRETVAQRQADGADTGGNTGARSENKTGLPDRLKAGIERLSGLALDDVRVHNNSDKPAQLQALAYTQGTEIHVAPGQERHLPHEAWHVVQQAQGRVRPTMQLKGGVPVNDDQALEREANVMGARAAGGTGRANGPDLEASSVSQADGREIRPYPASSVSAPAVIQGPLQGAWREAATIASETSQVVVQRVPIAFNLVEGVDHPVRHAGGVPFNFDTANGWAARQHIESMIINYRVRGTGMAQIRNHIQSSPEPTSGDKADKQRLLEWFLYKYKDQIARGPLHFVESKPEVAE